VDEDLKIVLAAELEADESASAQRIAAQLPNIAKLINDRSTIKVGVSLDVANVQSQMRTITSQLQRAAGTSKFQMNFQVGTEAVDRMVERLRGLRVPDDTIRDFVRNINDANTAVRSIQTSFDDVRNTVTATISGINKEGELITQIQSAHIVDNEQGERVAELTRNTVTLAKNYEQLTRQAEALDAKQRAAADSNTAYFQKWGAAIKEITAGYMSVGLGQEQLDALNKKMAEVVSATSGMTAEGEKFSKTQVTNVELAIKSYRDMADAAIKSANQQKSADENRLTYINKTQIALDKLVASFKGESSSKPLVDAGHLSEVEQKVTEITQTLEALRTATGEVGTEQQNQTAKALAELDALITKYRNLEYVATTLRTKTAVQINTEQIEKLNEFENSLKSAGILTTSFQQQIEALRGNLANAFDRESLTAYLNSFDKLKSSVSTFQQQVKSLDGIFSQIIGVEKQITALEASMMKLDPEKDQNKLVALRGELAILNQQKASLEAQLIPYSEIVQYSSQAKALEESRLMNGSRLVYTQMELADKAREYDVAMRQVPATIADLQTKFSQLVNPTESLKENMRQLRETAAQYNSDMGDREKVQTYERLSGLIRDCRREMSELTRAQGGTLNDFKFTQSLEKAKADLATVARTWSAFKSDPGLLNQFKQLETGLKNVNNQMDLRKWTAQFSTFKSEIKAAGKNMLSLGDVLKNNVGKVMQWVSATTLLFRAFRLLRQAVSTIVDLDTAMIDLQKVTTATVSEYQKFYRAANDTAKALGVTTEEVISQTAEWARLGYTLSEASELAKNSAIFEAISPDMDITQATDGLVSIIKAFDIEVEDAMDGIISKVNEVGNKFAVSNGDVVEALTRSSSAMAAANNTFDETVALATAAIEITRDAASVGNGLKTLSMRIRGYDEETEEYSEGVAELTGAIADLTKTAKTPGGISLFEKDDPETYRSTYDILADIADIWDDLTDKNRANLLEALFGKRQAQIGSAILSNFDQARDAIAKMEESAGSADREMSKIMDSLEYKLNALEQTWVGVAQNLFQTDDMKGVIEVLQIISNVVDTLTEHLGLFGSVGLVVAIAGLVKFRSTLESLTSVVTPVVQQLSKLEFDGTANSVFKYATALGSLDNVQRKLAMDMAGLTAQQQEQVVSMMAAVAAAKELTVAELEQQLGLQAGAIANALNVSSTSLVTEQMLKAAVANGVLSEAQLKQIVSTSAQTAANTAGAASFASLGTAAKAAGLAMMATPMGWITLLIGLLPLAITGITKLYDWLVVTAEEAYEEAEEYRKSYEEITSEVEDLNGKLEENKKRLEELQRMDTQGTITLVEQEELARLQQTNAELEITIARKKELAALDAKQANEGYVSSFNKTDFSSNRRDVLIVEQQSIYENYADLLKKYDDQMAGITVEWADGELEKVTELENRLFEISNILQSGIENDEWLDQAVDYSDHVQELVDTYNLFNKMQEDGIELSAAQKDLFERTRNELLSLGQELEEDYLGKYVGEDENTEEWQRLLDLINKTTFAVEYFSGKLSDLPEDCYSAMEELGGSSSLTADKVTELANKFPELAAWMQESGYTAEDVAKHFNALAASEEESGNAAEVYSAKLSDLAEVLSTLQDAYDALADAEADMATGEGLSPDTINALADAEENYLDYLYEENGVVKLNTEAWKENANAKMLGEMAELQKEIDSLKERNEVLADTLEIYRTNKYMSPGDTSMMDAWDKKIQEVTNEIDENTAAIDANQSRLDVLNITYGNITGNLDAYSATLANFSNVANTIDSVSTSFQTLADLQAEVANGFTMSLDKALEFAKVYPEILNNATVAANGQITLNKDVVNSFIQGKKAEIDAQIDSKITELEADKAVLEAQMEFSKAELDLAKQVGEGEANITKEVAAFRLDTANKLVAALIEAGVDEAEAFKLAAAAMAGNAQEFNRIAAEVCTDVNGNFNEAAYQVAQAIYQNMNSAKKDVASLATQAQQTAEAIAGMADGIKAGSSAIVGGSGGGTTGNGIKLNLSGADFKGTDYTYEAKEIGLDDFISDLELDISNYENAIAQIDGQIAALQALKNAPLKSFQSGGTSGGSSSSGSDNDVEEYIADIDEYREAVERLRKAQAEVERITTDIDNAGSIEKKIALEKELIGAYQEEQAALHNLNNLRDGTITAGVKTLQDLGFAVKYNADTNELWVENLEHLNELTADSKGQYGSLQEATNALRKDTEELINTITDLNEANQEGSATWWEVQRAILDAQIAVCEFEAQLHNNFLTLTENWLDNAINQKDSDNVKRYTTEMIANYKALQDVYHKQAEALRAAGYSDTTDEIVELSDAWWDLEDKIKDAKDKVVDYFVELVDAANDAVDSIQNVSDVLSDAAQEFADNDGWISVDTYQSIIALGTEYMQMLINENNELVINRDRINGIIEAKTRQLAVEQALSYVERLRLAATGASNESLDQLCFATTQATNSTWGLVYAELALMQQTGLLNGSQYQAALHNIQAIQSLAETAVAGIGQTAGAAAEKMDKLKEQLEDQKDALEDLLDELEDMKDGCDDLVKYVMDMLKDRIQQQIDALNDAKKAVKDYVDQLKEAMRAEKENVEYEDELADKLKAIAKLQSKIDALSLDDSRKAQAEKMALEEELAELQKDLADFQADHAMDVTEDTLDKQYEAYEQEKDAEIEKLEESISSTQKLYDMAIKYIKENWNTLYQELLDWNYEYGNSLNSEITAAWEAAQEAASRYGDFVTAIMGGIENEIAKITAQIQSLTTQISNLSNSTSDAGGNGIGGSMPNVVGTVNTDTSYSDEDMKQAKRKAVSDVVSQMRALSAQWHTADKATKKRLEDQALQLGATLASYGIVAHRDDPTGAWYIDNDLLNPSNAGKLLYSCYHTGGFVGDEPLKPNERYVKAENGELMVTSDQQDSLAAQISDIKTATDALSGVVADIPVTPQNLWADGMAGSDTGAVHNVTTNNNQPVFHVTETITCVPEKSVESHKKISRDTLVEIARQLRKP
jgi:TP901 family phage tail tape measure protein